MHEQFYLNKVIDIVSYEGNILVKTEVHLKMFSCWNSGNTSGLDEITVWTVIWYGIDYFLIRSRKDIYHTRKASRLSSMEK